MVSSLSLVLIAIVPGILATSMSNSPSNSQHADADIMKVLVKEVQELKLVVKLQGAQVTDLQNTVKKQTDHINDLEKRLSYRETFENLLKSTGEKSPSEGKLNHGYASPLGNTAANMTAEPGLDNDSRQPIENDSDLHSSNENSLTGNRLARGIRDIERGVAFCAYLDTKLTGLSVGHTIKFNQALLNDGNGYNVNTGIFTAPTTGVYLFTFFLEDYGSLDRAGVRLVIDNVNQVDAVVDAYGPHNQMGGNTAIVRVNAGQAVWLESYIWHDNDLGSSATERFVTFSGILMY